MNDVETSMWPLRRAIADLERDPNDDDRVDVQLSPALSAFCRACQAVIDGVIIELRLRGTDGVCVIVGAKISIPSPMNSPTSPYAFDADEESLFEASCFFLPENAALQRLRWLITLKNLHESKNQSLEAAETLIMCARTIAEAIQHIDGVWRPARFVLWHDSKRSPWLTAIGKTMGRPDRGNVQVMDFADSFLEPPEVLDDTGPTDADTLLVQPTISKLCTALAMYARQAVRQYLKEPGMEQFAFSQLEGLLRSVMEVVDQKSSYHVATRNSRKRSGGGNSRREVEEEGSLRALSATLNLEMSRLVGLMVREETEGASEERKIVAKAKHWYVSVQLSGQKPKRFTESTTIPTFLEWGSPSVCRVPLGIVDAAKEKLDASRRRIHDKAKLEEQICNMFAQPIINALATEIPRNTILLRTDPLLGDVVDSKYTFLVVVVVHMNASELFATQERQTEQRLESKRFFHRKGEPNNANRSRLVSDLVELTVAHSFPCAMSRQRTLITSEILSGT